jgi:hypothetical protein
VTRGTTGAPSAIAAGEHEADVEAAAPAASPLGQQEEEDDDLRPLEGAAIAVLFAMLLLAVLSVGAIWWFW